MRKIVLQRWALIFLLMSRLVIGELGHAMPMTSMSMSDHQQLAMVDADPAACPEHEKNESTEHSTDSADAQTCCETGECECPCLHVPCAGLDSVNLIPTDLSSRLITEGVRGLILQRLSGLFRPPA